MIVKLYFAYAIFASFLLQFYVPMDFLEPPLFELIKVDRWMLYYFPRRHALLKTVIQFTFRSVIVIIIGRFCLVGNLWFV